MSTDYADLDATALAERVKQGEVQPIELVERAIAALEQVNPRLNAVVHRMYDQARLAARGPLPDGPFRGVPIVVKDLDGYVAGEPYGAGCRMLTGFVPDHDAEIIARLRRAGMIIVAKASTSELGILAVTETAVNGATRNPWDETRTPGGSSGGTGALVAARAVPMGHAADGGGSIRIPAAACGLVGLKPSRGRNPVGPDAGEGWGGYTQPHVLARSVRDVATALDVTCGEDAGAPYAAPSRARPFLDEVGAPVGRLRVAFSTGSLYGRQVHPDCAEAVRATARLLESLGHEVEEATPRFDRDAMVHAYFVQIAASVAAAIDEVARLAGRRPTPSGFEPPTWLLGQIGRTLSAAELQASRDACQALSRTLARFHERYDVFLCATLADHPAKIGELGLRGVDRAALAFLRAVPSRRLFHRVLAELGGKNLERTPNTMMFNQTGQPAISLPLQTSPSGLPVGVQLAARFGDEATLLRLAAQLEAAQPWQARRPAVCAS